MSRRGLVINTLVALIAILITGGLAAQAVIRDPSSPSDSKLVAAGVDGRDAFAIESPGSTAATRPTANTQPRPRPTTTATVPRVVVTTVTTVPAPPETTIPPVTTNPTPPPPHVPDPWLPPPPPPPPPPVVIQTGPSSWSFEDQGVIITASVSPTEPRVGDTVTISFSTGRGTTGGDAAGDNCCRAVAFVGQEMAGYTLRAQGDPCQPGPVTSGTGSVVASQPGPLTFVVEATRDPAGCAGPFEFTNVSLDATVQVVPAA